MLILGMGFGVSGCDSSPADPVTSHWAPRDEWLRLPFNIEECLDIVVSDDVVVVAAGPQGFWYWPAESDTALLSGPYEPAWSSAPPGWGAGAAVITDSSVYFGSSPWPPDSPQSLHVATRSAGGIIEPSEAVPGVAMNVQGLGRDCTGTLVAISSGGAVWVFEPGSGAWGRIREDNIYQEINVCVTDCRFLAFGRGPLGTPLIVEQPESRCTDCRWSSDLMSGIHAELLARGNTITGVALFGHSPSRILAGLEGVSGGLLTWASGTEEVVVLADHPKGPVIAPSPNHDLALVGMTELGCWRDTVTPSATVELPELESNVRCIGVDWSSGTVVIAASLLDGSLTLWARDLSHLILPK